MPTTHMMTLSVIDLRNRTQSEASALTLFTRIAQGGAESRRTIQLIRKSAQVRIREVDDLRDLLSVTEDAVNFLLQQVYGPRVKLVGHPERPRFYSVGVEFSSGEIRPLKNSGVIYFDCALNAHGEDANFADSRDARVFINDTFNTYPKRVDVFREVLRDSWYRDTREPKSVHSGGGDFERFLTQVLNTNEYEGHSFISEMPLAERGTLASRNWGIEVEHVDAGGVDAPMHWEYTDDGSLEPVAVGDYRDHDSDCASLAEYEYCTCGDCRYDCDCGADDGDSSCREYVSPVLRSYHSRGLQELSNNLYGRATNSSAGVHVHVDAAGLTERQVARAALIYNTWRPLFVHELNRDGETYYCAPLSIIDLVRMHREAKNDPATVRGFAFANVVDRYRNVNINALGKHGTIEFREMGQTYDYETLIKWAYFLRELVNVAASNITQREWMSVTSVEDVIKLFAKYGKETPHQDWMPSYIADGNEDRLVFESPNYVAYDDARV